VKTHFLKPNRPSALKEKMNQLLDIISVVTEL